MDEDLLDALDDARALREDADYRTEFSESGARHGLEKATQFLKQANLLLANWEEPSEE